MGRPASSRPHSLQKLKEKWRTEWEAEHLHAASEEEEAAEAVLKRLQVLRQRIWYQQFVPWMDDAEKRAAHERTERNGRLTPEEEARIGYGGSEV